MATDISNLFTFSGMFSGTPRRRGGRAWHRRRLGAGDPIDVFTAGSDSGTVYLDRHRQRQLEQRQQLEPGGHPGSGVTTQLTFGATPNAAMTDDVAGALVLNSMTFNAGSPAYTLSASAGNSLNFQSNGATLPQIVSNSANSVTISVPADA